MCGCTVLRLSFLCNWRQLVTFFPSVNYFWLNADISCTTHVASVVLFHLGLLDFFLSLLLFDKPSFFIHSLVDVHFGHFQFSSVTNSNVLTFAIVSPYKRLGFSPRSQTSGSLSMGLFKLLAISGSWSKRSGPTQLREACFLSACSLVPGMFRRIHFSELMM